jgi:predicted GNAT family acetyltransferase
MSSEDFAIRDNRDEGRYELFVGDELAGYAEYVLSPSTIVFTHTVVEEEWNGRGFGSRLARHVLDDARVRSLRVRPKCPFIRSYIEHHAAYADLVVPRTDEEPLRSTEKAPD